LVYQNTIEFLGILERINDPNFDPIEFDGFGKRAGLNSFVLAAKMMTATQGMFEAKRKLLVA